MRKLVVAGLAALALLAPFAASAQLFLGARLGYAFPSGDLYKNFSVKETTTGMIPVQVDFGLDVAKAVAVGVYGSAGYTLIGGDFKTFCDATPGLSCSGTNFRLGAQATLHAPVGESKVWGGPLLGWEQQQFKMSGGGSSLEVAYRGIEAGLQGGLDFAPAGSFRWGPFVSASVGQYQSSGVTGSGGVLTAIIDKAPHYWLTLGLRGVFGL